VRSAEILDLPSAFSIWHYRWCLTQTEQEIREGFPWLRQIQNSTANNYVKELMQLDAETQYSLARALVKRFQLSALRLQNEQLSSDENENIAKFLRKADIARIAHRERRSEKIADRVGIDKTLLKAEIRGRLDPQFGRPKSIGGGAFRYTMRLGNFELSTDIDIGGKRPLGYLHALSFGGKRLHKWISLLQWHGISSHTTWDCMLPGEEVKSAALLATLCVRFTAAFHTFVNSSIETLK
jgi:hypothetical protein